MSTQPCPNATEADIATASNSFVIRNAPRTFDPFNTNPCPRMFADKWMAAGE